MKRLATALLCAAAALAPATAGAKIWNFKITGNGSANFSIDTSVTKPWSINNTGITYANLPGVYNGVARTRFVQFFNNTSHGGFNVGFVGQGKGAMLFTGSHADPVFTVGTYQMLPLAFGAPGGFTVTISQAGVPEPATWGLMILGFGAVGFGMRARKRKRTRIAFA